MKPEETAQRPPLGLVPKLIWDEMRIRDIEQAMDRYAEAGKEIPDEWHLEMSFLFNNKGEIPLP